MNASEVESRPLADGRWWWCAYTWSEAKQRRALVGDGVARSLPEAEQAGRTLLQVRAMTP